MEFSVERSYWMDARSAEDYHKVKNLCIPVAEQFVLEYYQQANPTWKMGEDKIPLIVDVGCGSGQLSDPMSKYCDKLLGIDISKEQIAMAQRHNTRPNVRYEVASAFNFSRICRERSIDLLIVGEAAHYFDTDVFYREVKKCLKPGGVVAIVGYYFSGFQHTDQRFKSCLTNLWIAKALDDTVLRVAHLLRNSYRDLYFPMSNETRRESNYVDIVTKDYVRQLLTSLKVLLKGQSSTVDDFMETLPPDAILHLKFKVFAIFSHEV